LAQAIFGPSHSVRVGTVLTRGFPACLPPLSMAGNFAKLGAYLLVSVLDGIWLSSALPLAEKGRLCHRVTSLALGTPTAVLTLSADVVSRLEEVLSLATSAVQDQGPRLSITQVKHRLRARGRADLAARLSRLSKGRNAAAHPDVSLSCEVWRTLPSSAPLPEIFTMTDGLVPSGDDAHGRDPASADATLALTALPAVPRLADLRVEWRALPPVAWASLHGKFAGVCRLRAAADDDTYLQHLDAPRGDVVASLSDVARPENFVAAMDVAQETFVADDAWPRPPDGFGKIELGVTAAINDSLAGANDELIAWMSAAIDQGTQKAFAKAFVGKLLLRPCVVAISGCRLHVPSPLLRPGGLMTTCDLATGST